MVIVKSLASQGIFAAIRKVYERVEALRNRSSGPNDYSLSVARPKGLSPRLRRVGEVMLKVLIAIAVHFAAAQCLVGLFRGSR